MKRLKRIILVVSSLIVVLTVAGAMLLWRSGSIEGWIGSQLQLIANAYLKPQLSFTELHFTYPNQVSLKNFRLVADDPAQPGKTIDILACENASISLAEVPSIGKPIVIEKFVFEKPLLSAIAVRAGSKEFVGFSQLLRKADVQTQSGGPGTAAMRLSDLLRMRQVELTDGKIVYDPRIAGTVPMMLDQITTTLDFAPAEVGWYKLGTHINRPPVFDLRVGGLLNLDTFSVKDIGIQLLADLGQDKLDYLPPELQKVLKQYGARGKLAVSISGSMPVMEPLKGNVAAQVKLEKANLTMGACRIPVDRFELDAQMAQGRLMLPKLHVEGLKGTADVTASVTLNDRWNAQLHLAVAQMQLNELLAGRSRGAGTTRLDTELNITGPLRGIIGKVPMSEGEAAVNVDHLRLSAEDPRSPGKTLNVFACDHAAATLASALTTGGPLTIRSILLQKPEISLVATQSGSRDLAGVSDLLPSEIAPMPTATPQAAPASSHKISDLIQVGRVQIDDGGLAYDPRIPDTQPMIVDEINCALDFQSSGANTGLYKMSVAASRKPAFDMTIAGLIDPDALGIRGVDMHLSAAADKDNLDFLPPQLQRLLRQYDIAGDFRIAASGSLDIGTPGGGDLATQITGEAAATYGDYRIRLDHVRLPVRYHDGRVDFLAAHPLGGSTIDALDGTADLTGYVTLDKQLSSALDLHVSGMMLQDLTSQSKDPTVAELAGRLDTAVHVQVPLALLAEAINAPKSSSASEPAIAPAAAASLLSAHWGNGTLNLTHARLVNIPVIDSLTKKLEGLFNQQKQDAPSESVDLTYTLSGDHADLSAIQYAGGVLGVRGKGIITLAQNLDMTIKAGPIEKLEALFATGIQNVIDSVSDVLITYHVTGTLKNPSIAVVAGKSPLLEQTLAAGTHVAKQGVEVGAKKVGDGLNTAGHLLGKLFRGGN